MFVVNQQHPRDCHWESYPTEQLVERISEFGSKSGLFEHDRWGKRPNVGVTYNEWGQPIYTIDPTPIEQPWTSARLTLFLDSGPDVQSELVTAAQGYAAE